MILALQLATVSVENAVFIQGFSHYPNDGSKRNNDSSKFASDIGKEGENLLLSYFS